VVVVHAPLVDVILKGFDRRGEAEAEKGALSIQNGMETRDHFGLR
jgi:hypothetical protein